MCYCILRWHVCKELLWCKTKHEKSNEKIIFNIISLDIVTATVGLINYIAKTPNLDLHNLPFIVWLFGDICS